jgi:hypothetical protein
VNEERERDAVDEIFVFVVCLVSCLLVEWIGTNPIPLNDSASVE